MKGAEKMDLKKKVVNALAGKLDAYWNCVQSGNDEWRDRHAASISLIMEGTPSGSGIDNGTSIDMERSTPNNIVFNTSFHHMVEGYYDGWTEHKVTVRPSFVHDIDVHVSGRNRNDIKEYLAETFDCWLREDAPEA